MPRLIHDYLRCRDCGGHVTIWTPEPEIKHFFPHRFELWTCDACPDEAIRHFDEAGKPIVAYRPKQQHKEFR